MAIVILLGVALAFQHFIVGVLMICGGVVGAAFIHSEWLRQIGHCPKCGSGFVVGVTPQNRDPRNRQCRDCLHRWSAD